MKKQENMEMNTGGLLGKNYIKLILMIKRVICLINLNLKLEENFKLFWLINFQKDSKKDSQKILKVILITGQLWMIKKSNKFL